MPDTILPFASERRCVKCGYKKSRTEYREARKAGRKYIRATFRWGYHVDLPALDEALKRTCERCGFVWYERCKDAEEERDI